MSGVSVMLRDLTALQSLATAGGLRSVHRDPREEAGRTTGGRKVPDATALERASDAGDLARARFASRVIARCPASIADTLRWIADRAHGGDGDWSRYLANGIAPGALRDAVQRADDRLSLARSQRAALRAALTRGSRRVTATSVRDAETARKAAAAADVAVAMAEVVSSRATAALHRWGERRMTACVDAWTAARAEVLREMNGEESAA